jgi:hypothetical protein
MTIMMPNKNLVGINSIYISCQNTLNIGCSADIKLTIRQGVQPYCTARFKPSSSNLKYKPEQKKSTLKYYKNILGLTCASFISIYV